MRTFDPDTRTYRSADTPSNDVAADATEAPDSADTSDKPKTATLGETTTLWARQSPRDRFVTVMYILSRLFFVFNTLLWVYFLVQTYHHPSEEKTLHLVFLALIVSWVLVTITQMSLRVR